MSKKFKIIIAVIVIIGVGMVGQYFVTGKAPVSVFSRPQGVVGNYQIAMNSGSGILNHQTNTFTVKNTSDVQVPALKSSDITLVQNNKVIPVNEYSVDIASDNGTYASGQSYGLTVKYDFSNDTKYPVTLVVNSGNQHADINFQN